MSLQSKLCIIHRPVAGIPAAVFTRDVNLIVTDPVHVAVDGTTVTTPDIESGKGSVSTKIEVVNDKNASADVTVRTTVYDSGNQKVSDTVQKTISIAANSVSEAELSTLVGRPDSLVCGRSDPLLCPHRLDFRWKSNRYL